MPSVSRKVIPWACRVALFGLSFEVGLATASADEKQQVPKEPFKIAHRSVYQPVSLERVAATFNTVPTSATKNVTPKRIRIGPIAKPQKLAEITMTPVKTVEPLEANVLQKVARREAPEPPQAATFLLGKHGAAVSLSPVTKRWVRALGKLETEVSDRHQNRAYAAIFNQVRDNRRGLQIPKINYLVNRFLSYRKDMQIWNTAEYWASPMESLARRAGDCEDFAILKYALLRDLGVKDADMRIVVLMDTAARQYHAVLSVRHKRKWLILDNRFSRVRFERDLPNYQPLYAVNAAGEWSYT